MLLKSQANVAILHYCISTGGRIMSILWYITKMQISYSITGQEYNLIPQHSK